MTKTMKTSEKPLKAMKNNDKQDSEAVRVMSSAVSRLRLPFERPFSLTRPALEPHWLPFQAMSHVFLTPEGLHLQGGQREVWPEMRGRASCDHEDV